MRDKALLLATLILTALIYACGTETTGKGEPGDEIQLAVVEGKKARDFTLPDLNGGKVTLSDLRGKVVLLNFWATWCPPCREEMPSMESLHKKYEGKDMVVLAVAIDRKGEKIVRPFIEEKGFTFPVLIDKKGDVSDSYGVFAVPTTYIIGKDGTVLEKVQGAADWFDTEALAYFEDLIGKAERT